MFAEVIVDIAKDFFLERSVVYLYAVYGPELFLTSIGVIVGVSMGNEMGLITAGTCIAYGVLCLTKIRKYKKKSWSVVLKKISTQQLDNFYVKKLDQSD